MKIILFGSATREAAVINDVDVFIIKDDVPALGAERIRQLYRMMDTNLPVDYRGHGRVRLASMQ
jgi:predicted nucleotidyltransferase